MGFESLRRRSYLGGVTAALAGLAGCQGGDSTDADADTTAQTTERTSSTQADTTQQDALPTHDHSGGDAGGSALNPGRVNGDVYAARMPGDDLSAKVRTAIEEAPTGGTVIVTPREDGTPWTWSDTLTINLKETGGLSLLFRGTTMVEYTGDGWAIETTYRPAEYGQLSQGAFLRLRGGNWRATGNPDGWLRMIDTNFCEIHPERVIDFTNDEQTATGIRVEIQDIFAESNVFGGHFATVDVGMDFVPSDTPGIASDTENAGSFQGNYVRNVKVLNASKYGFRWREGSRCQGMTVQTPDAFAGTYNAADKVVLYELGGDFDGAVFLGPKTEDAGSTNEENDVNDVAFRLTEKMGTPPLVINPLIGHGVDTTVERDDKYKTLPSLKTWDDGYRWQAGIHDLGRRTEEAYHFQRGTVFPAQTFTGGPPNPERPGHVVYFDDENADVPPGLYRADPENDQWVKVEDNSITQAD